MKSAKEFDDLKKQRMEAEIRQINASTDRIQADTLFTPSDFVNLSAQAALRENNKATLSGIGKPRTPAAPGVKKSLELPGGGKWNIGTGAGVEDFEPEYGEAADWYGYYKAARDLYTNNPEYHPWRIHRDAYEAAKRYTSKYRGGKGRSGKSLTRRGYR